MSTVSHGIGISLIAGTWLAVLSFGLTPLYIHLLGIESFGLIGLYTATVAVGGILDVTLSATASREIAWLSARPNNWQRIGDLLRSIEIVYWSSVALLLVISLMILPKFGESAIRSSLPPNQIRYALALMAVSMAIHLPCGLYAASLSGMARQARSALILAGLGTVRGIGAALVAWGISDDIRVFFAWYAAIGVIQVIWLRKQAWSYIETSDGRPKFALESLASVKSAAGAMFLITVMGMILSQMDKFVIGAFVSLEALGHYALAWSLASGLSILSTPVAQGFGVHFSTLASGQNELELSNQIYKASQWMYALIIPPAMTLSLYAEEILNIWIQDAVLAPASAPALSLLALGTGLVSCIYPVLNALYAKKLFKPVLIVQFVCLLAFLPILMILVRSNGINGAALSWALYGGAIFATYLWILAKVSGGKALPNKISTTFLWVVGVSFCVNWAAKYVAGEFEGKLQILGFLILVFVVGWLFAIIVCPGLRVAIFARNRMASGFSRKY